MQAQSVSSHHSKGVEKEAFKNTYIKHARENSKDRSHRLIFIPDKKHVKHWCVVYPEGRMVDRAVLAPPEN